MKTWIIDEGEAGQKILDYLQSKIGPHESRRRIKYFLEQNGCTVNGELVNYATRVLEKDDNLGVYLPRLQELMPPVKSLDSDRILYEDDDLLIYDKPANINSEGSQSLIELLRRLYPQAQLCHRLDRLTTGVIAIGKHSEVTKGVKKLFEEREVEKTYWAILDGVPEKSSGCIESFIGRTGFTGGQVHWGEVPEERGSEAITEWRRKAVGEGACLMRCYPKSGRTHQIRVHMHSLGYPILGDSQYCRRFRSLYIPARPLLHARSLVFKHPVTGVEVKARAPVPDDFFTAAKELSLEMRQ